ncbi:MAG: DNA topoisomerase I [Atopobiaceae bacterium]|nr:DNA topoisomerase I [Atopobiaceae bacterium]MCH4180226.1 DNA topoisomerase I [Atopobiaceae bacterium]MCH4214396.1 DNA topoisomerase I [Atopobiaceae bacterium]MCH4229173.1 DNA topoisomerase I [Atopobiaceae bacterium]MCH4276544.1 DNA topoisomerase I [Atopobiaceae bacterium]
MKLVVTEKNNAAQKIAQLLCDVGRPKTDKVYDTSVYRFDHDGEEWVTIGLRGHILAPDFPPELRYTAKDGWFGLTEDGEVLPARIPDDLPRPPFKKKKPFLEDGVDIKGWKVSSLPYLVWAPIQKEPAEKGIIRALKNLAKKADSIVIGTDFDREGELIGSDALAQMREVAPDVPVSRARYSALTKGEIDHAFENLVDLDQDLADAGESRQYIDLIWGAALTRYLTMAKFGGFGNVRSAGRVQTPTLALVVAREKERDAFDPKDYWVISGMGSHAGEDFKLTHATARFWEKPAADLAFSHIEGRTSAMVTNVTTRSRTQRPPVPFNTTTLQTTAAGEGLSPARTMRLAESLYMDGLISYPRVDNTVYPKSLDLRGTVKALSAVPQYASVCRGLLAQDALVPTRGKQETTDHPPIHPTAAADPDKLEPAAWKLYNLIARRFLATLMGPATIEGTKVEFDCGGEPLQTSGDVLADAGFRAIYPFGLKRDEQLPALAAGDAVDVSKMSLDAKQTEPPARYSQGRLIQEMEKAGLGTKSTRASIIERLYTVKYLKNDPIEPSKLGMAVIEALHSYAPHITTPDMTSELEADMTKVAEGTDTQDAVVDHSRALLAGMLDDLIDHKDDLGEAISDAVTADAKVGVCPKCGRDLVMKHSAKNRSSFIGCMGWPDCDVTYPVPNGRISPIEGEAGVCPDCGAPRVKVSPFRSKPYECCVNPACPTNQEPDVLVGECAACKAAGKHGDLVAHKSERTGKRFIRCTNYDECGTSYPLPQRGELHATGETCPDCGAPIVEVITARGPWRICVNMDCPGKEKKAAGPRGRGGRGAAKKPTAKKSTKKATAKKATKKPAKKTTTKKTTTKKAAKKVPSDKE